MLSTVVCEDRLADPDTIQVFDNYFGVFGDGTPRGLNGPTWALVEERGGGQEVGAPPKPNPNWEGPLRESRIRGSPDSRTISIGRTVRL